MCIKNLTDPKCQFNDSTYVLCGPLLDSIVYYGRHAGVHASLNFSTR